MRIDFYILADAATGARDQLSCRIAEKAYKAGHRVLVFTGSEAHAGRIDELLWTFRDGSFVPHARATDPREPTPPVIVASPADSLPDAADVLINLAPAVPEFYRRFSRIAEIVDASEDGRRLGRERFRFYRNEGMEPQSHDIG